MSKIGTGFILPEALCGQDFSYFTWPRPQDNINQKFEIHEAGERYKCVASGYGAVGDYGNGAIYTDKENVELNNRPGKTYPAAKVRALVEAANEAVAVIGNEDRATRLRLVASLAALEATMTDRYEKDGKVLIVDEVTDGTEIMVSMVYYRTWVNGAYNGAWRKDADEFDRMLKEWLEAE